MPTATTMPAAYVFAQLRIRDRARYDRYAAAFMQTLAPFAARLLAADEAPEVLEGEWPFAKVVLLEFRDRAEAQRWLASPEYQRIALDRRAATTAAVISFRSLRPWSEPGA